MGAAHVSVTAPWATYADGRPLLGQHADFTVVDARIDDLPVTVLEDCAEARYGCGLAELADVSAADVPEDVESEEAEEEFNILQGATQMRGYLKDALRAVATDRRDGDFDFDGRRWTVSTGGSSWGDDPNDLYGHLRLLAETGVCDAPLDAPTFDDAPAIAATVTVLDELVDVVRRALAYTDVADSVRARVKEQLEEARCEVTGAAATFRRVLDQMTTQRQAEAGRLRAAGLAAGSLPPMS